MSTILDAVRGGDLDGLRRLLAALSTDEIRTALLEQDEIKMTPLHRAAWKGSVESVKELMKHANVAEALTMVDRAKKTPLHWAVEEGTEESVKELMKHANIAASLTMADNDKMTPLHSAALKGSVESVKELMKHANISASLTMVDWRNKTPLHLAVATGSVECVKELMKHANIAAALTMVDGSKKTPLHLAVEVGTMEIVKELMKHANIAEAFIIVDKSGKTPLDLLVAKNLLDNFDLDTFYTSVQRPSFLEPISRNYYKAWFEFVQLSGDAASINAQMIKIIISIYPHLAEAKDDSGRRAIDVATATNITLINSMLLVHGRYRLHDLVHQSKTCTVYLASDEGSVDENGNIKPAAVAIKFMFNKAQYLREIGAREYNFDPIFVINVIRSHPEIPVGASVAERDMIISSFRDIHGAGEGASKNKGLPKLVAEKLYAIVMPLAERNLYVAMKQERFAGRDLETVKFVMRSVIECLRHMHSKGVVHSDVKPLNIMRKDGKWLVIDLDAAGKEGIDNVGFKSSTGYVCPEAIFINAEKTVAVVRSEETLKQFGPDCHVLIAHESFDVWSVGCISYQLLNQAVFPLWLCGQDDNLSDDKSQPDNLFVLAEFSDHVKAKKLELIDDKLARNLLSQMLMKDPKKRPSFSRVLAHPFFTGKVVIRMAGEEAEYDFFLSYRVASDTAHVNILYDLLTSEGYKVWWDVKCLESGKNGEEGFCDGLLNSKAFICIISKDAINHSDVPWQNFGNLTEQSRCDNVLLEHRLALELSSLGLLEFIFPVFVGNPVGPITLAPPTPAATYEAWNWSNMPASPDIHVHQVEEKLIHHLDAMALGMPLTTNKTVKAVVTDITSNQGFFLQGEGVQAFKDAKDKIIEMLAHSKTAVQGSASSSGATITDFQSEIDKLKADNVRKERETAAMSAEMASKDAKLASKDTEIALKDAEIERLRALSTRSSATAAIIPTDPGLLEKGMYQAILSEWKSQLGLQPEK